jgi:hypothetical protein
VPLAAASKLGPRPRGADTGDRVDTGVVLPLALPPLTLALTLALALALASLLPLAAPSLGSRGTGSVVATALASPPCPDTATADPVPVTLLGGLLPLPLAPPLPVALPVALPLPVPLPPPLDTGTGAAWTPLLLLCLPPLLSSSCDSGPSSSGSSSSSSLLCVKGTGSSLSESLSCPSLSELTATDNLPSSSLPVSVWLTAGLSPAADKGAAATHPPKHPRMRDNNNNSNDIKQRQAAQSIALTTTGAWPMTARPVAARWQRGQRQRSQ